MTTRFGNLLGAFVVLGVFLLAIFPENPAKRLTVSNDWSARGDGATDVVPLRAFSEQYRQLRHSVSESTAARILRTWTPDKGVVQQDYESAPFRPSRFMSVVITGANRTPQGLVQTYIECIANGQRLDVFRGSVNTHVAEALVVVPKAWCPGEAKVKFRSAEQHNNVGIGDVFEISLVSYVKSSYLGRLPYLITAFTMLSLVMFAGVSLARRLRCECPVVPIALIALGAVSLGIFYFASAISLIGATDRWRWVSTAALMLLTLIALRYAGPDARRTAAHQLITYARMWGIAGLVYFTILSLTSNQLGHWDPNYRFWPATWSSDNELPWLFAEAIRHGWDLQGLLGGGWSPTDRPPLMAGAHILMSDAFALLQSNNDGNYLRGSAYNAAAVLLNALWVPAVWWLLESLTDRIDNRGRMSVLVFVAGIPFVLFNTVYGWPKAFGAAFALVAFGLAWQSRSRGTAKSDRTMVLLFFMLGAFSMLAHASTALFLLPLGTLFLLWNVRRDPRGIIVGFSVAFALLATWFVYKLLVLPSTDPVTKYALTGDFGFGHSDWSLWRMISDRYREIDLWRWVEIKRIMLLQAFMPLQHSVTQIGLNSDFGSGAMDRLRAWDFMLLSRGNVAIPIMAVVSGWVSIRSIALQNRQLPNGSAPFLTLVMVSIVAWLLVVLGFLVPPVLHIWPQAAVFGLALGGAVVTRQIYPKLFELLVLAMLTYTVVVWILSPLQHALDIDAGAAIVLVILILWLGRSIFLGVPSRADLSNSTQVNGRQLNSTAGSLGLHSYNVLLRIGSTLGSHVTVRLIAVGALLFCSYIAIQYMHQPLADVHAFRQTQTAITAYWMLKDGLQLAYQTPVAGFPWAIPFEFPIYQALVAALTAIAGGELEAVGRLLSYIFLVACAWPAFALGRRLSLPGSVPLVFCTLLWTSPLNVYWGRTFMIETAALFFSLACLPYGLDLIRRVGGWRSILMFVVFASAAVLQKSTTGGPVLLFLFCAALFTQFRKTGFVLLTIRQTLIPMSAIAVPVIIGLAWAHYADVVKLANPFGSQLTSSVLTQWNFGTVEQKLNPETWRLVVWERSLSWNAGGWLAIFLLLVPWVVAPEHRKYAWLSLAALVLFLLPVVIFTNLHFVHEYYQVACVAFLLGALSIVIGGWLPRVTQMSIVIPVVTLVIVISNLMVFSRAYGIVAARTLDELDPRSVQAYKVGRYLRDHTPQGSGLVVFGQAYSSEIAFQAQRKAMTVPSWFSQYRKLWEQPERYLGDVKLSAMVICPPTDDFPTLRDLQDRKTREPDWTQVNVNGCEILLKSANNHLANE